MNTSFKFIVLIKYTELFTFYENSMKNHDWNSKAMYKYKIKFINKIQTFFFKWSATNPERKTFSQQESMNY